MPHDYLPAKDTLLQDWLANFITVANANLAALGLVAGDITPLSTDKTTFDTQITAEATAKGALKSATQAKKTTRKSAETKARSIVKRIQANTAVTNALKAQLQITVPGSSPSPVNPITPANLTVETLPNGSKRLSWDRAGNPQGVQFLVETNTIPPAQWQLVASVTKTTYDMATTPTGGTITAQVKAQKGNLVSLPSNVVMV